MIGAQQFTGGMHLGATQAPALPFQAGAIPAQTNGLDISALMNMMVMMVIVMMLRGRA